MHDDDDDDSMSLHRAEKATKSGNSGFRKTRRNNDTRDVDTRRNTRKTEVEIFCWAFVHVRKRVENGLLVVPVQLLLRNKAIDNQFQRRFLAIQ